MKQLNMYKRFIEWLLYCIAKNIPETSKRFVLYELQSRVIIKDENWNGDKDEWKITFEQIYDELRD